MPAARPLRYDRCRSTCATDLELIATCAGVDAAEIEALNPALVRGVDLARQKTTRCRCRRARARRRRWRWPRFRPTKRLTWSRHRVARGETLGRIAATYGTTVARHRAAQRAEQPYIDPPGRRAAHPDAGRAERNGARADGLGAGQAASRWQVRRQGEGRPQGQGQRTSRPRARSASATTCRRATRSAASPRGWASPCTHLRTGEQAPAAT